MKTIGIIGTGAVGSSAAFAIFKEHIASTLWLYDVDQNAANACAMDLIDAASLANEGSNILVASSVSELINCDILALCFTAGICKNRADEYAKNAVIIKQLASELVGFKGILLVATNPNDAIVYAARKAFNLPASRVIGTGTSIDSSRLCARISGLLNVKPACVDACMLGEHGDSQLLHSSAAMVDDKPLEKAFLERGKQLKIADLEAFVRERGHEVFRLKGKTEYAIASALAKIAAAIVRGERLAICASFVQSSQLISEQSVGLVIAAERASIKTAIVQGPDDAGDVAFSRPVVIAQSGIIASLEIRLNQAELDKLKASVEFIKSIINQS